MAELEAFPLPSPNMEEVIRRKSVPYLQTLSWHQLVYSGGKSREKKFLKERPGYAGSQYVCDQERRSDCVAGGQDTCQNGERPLYQMDEGDKRSRQLRNHPCGVLPVLLAVGSSLCRVEHYS